MKILNDANGEVDGKVILTLSDCRRIMEAFEMINEAGDHDLYGKVRALAELLEADGS